MRNPNFQALLPFPVAELKRRLNRKSYDRLLEYVHGIKRCPAELALQIETITGRAVLRGDIRPDLWPMEFTPKRKDPK